jgi:hypothetical protein
MSGDLSQDQATSEYDRRCHAFLSEVNLIVQAHNVFLCSATEGPFPRGTQFIAQQRAQFLDQLQLSVGQLFEALTQHQQALFAIHHECIQHQQAVALRHDSRSLPRSSRGLPTPLSGTYIRPRPCPSFAHQKIQLLRRSLRSSHRYLYVNAAYTCIHGHPPPVTFPLPDSPFTQSAD